MIIKTCCAEEGALRAVLSAYGKPLAIAFSGGVDSRALAFCALRAGLDVVALHAFGPHIPAAETAYALDFAQRVGLPLLKIEFDPLALPGVADNGKERCYFCKKALIAAMAEALNDCEATEQAFAAVAGTRPRKINLKVGVYGGRTLCDGSNADDLLAYRPGMVALREDGVLSPLAGAGLSKAAIRRMAQLAGMENPQQASRPCLLTRLAYGMNPNAEILRRLADVEAELQVTLGIDNFRLRLTPEPLLQCPELAPRQRHMALEVLARRGFTGTAILEGNTISGFFD